LNLNAPSGRTAPRGLVGPAGTCGAEDRSCQSFNFGYNAALHAVAYARSQGVTAPFWWLDVETENTWSENRTLNARVIQGALDALRSQGLAAGIYSTGYQWNEIAGSFSPGLPVWVAGASSRAQAQSFCTATAAFGGGTVVLVQYPDGLFSGEYAC
jgi:GH25 family lysozyme M1 (1,4-beta-N-acetylmuramidase)